MGQPTGGCTSTHERLAELCGAAPVVLPSLLLCDFAELRREIEAVEEAGARALHLDVMDGHFVPNLTYGLPFVETVRRLTTLPLDVHLMISNPGEYVRRYVEAGADLVSIHIEAAPDPRPILAEIREAGAAAALALNPPTDVAAVEPFADDCDLILVMSVMPGFGGQEFDPRALDKLRTLRSRLGRSFPLEIDGGINQSTTKRCAEAGADLFVVGSAIFRSDDYSRSLAELTSLAQSVGP